MNRIDVMRILKINKIQIDEVMEFCYNKVGRGRSIVYSEDNLKKIKAYFDAKNALKKAKLDLKGMIILKLDNTKSVNL